MHTTYPPSINLSTSSKLFNQTASSHQFWRKSLFFVLFTICGIFVFLEWKAACSLADIPIYVVTLRRPQGRVENIHKQLTGLPYTVFDASDGYNLTTLDKQLIKRYISQNSTLRWPQIGCFLSHIRLWQKMNRENISFALICEDDLKTKVSLRVVLPKLIRLSGYDIVYLGHYFDSPTGQIMYTIGQFNLHRSVHPLCLHGYLMTLHAAQICLDWLEKYKSDVQADYFLLHLIQQNMLRSLSAYPSMIATVRFPSTLEHSLPNINRSSIPTSFAKIPSSP